jgi:hypothetical protein
MFGFVSAGVMSNSLFSKAARNATALCAVIDISIPPPVFQINASMDTLNVYEPIEFFRSIRSLNNMRTLRTRSIRPHERKFWDELQLTARAGYGLNSVKKACLPQQHFRFHPVR